MKLVTDGEKWAIKRDLLGPAGVDITGEFFVFPASGEIHELFCVWTTINLGPIVNCWTDKETAERWFRRLTA